MWSIFCHLQDNINNIWSYATSGDDIILCSTLLSLAKQCFFFKFSKWICPNWINFRKTSWKKERTYFKFQDVDVQKDFYFSFVFRYHICKELSNWFCGKWNIPYLNWFRSQWPDPLLEGSGLSQYPPGQIIPPKKLE